MDPFSLKKKSATKFIKKETKKSASLVKNRPDRIVSLGIMAEVNMLKSYDFTRSLIQDLGLREEDVKVALLDPEAEKTVEWEGHKVFAEDSFGMGARIKAGELENFVRREFDLLIDYTHDSWVFSQVVLLRSRAKLKAGFPKEGQDQTDISIEVPANRIDDFQKELVRYLKILNYI